MQLCFASGMTSEQLAAWVQAVGSVIAIFAAIGVAWHQSKKSEKQQLDARNQIYEEKFGPTIGLLQATIDTLEKEVEFALETVINNKLYKPTEEFDYGCSALISAISKVPAHELPSPVAVQSLMRARKRLGIASSSYLSDKNNVRRMLDGTEDQVLFFKSTAIALRKEVNVLNTELANLTNVKKAR